MTGYAGYRALLEVPNWFGYRCTGYFILQGCVLGSSIISIISYLTITY